MTVNIESIRFLGPDIAIEKGMAKVKLPGKEATRDHVIPWFTPRDGKWTMVVGRDAPYVSGSNGDYLKDLGWLIGDWRSEPRPPLHLHFEWMGKGTS